MAAGPMAGYLFQIERAVFHLAESTNANSLVGIETIDDVVVLDGEDIKVREQDKHSLGTSAMTAQSRGLWRTLRIWLDDSRIADSYFLVTTRPIASQVLASMTDDASTRPPLNKIIQSLDAARRRIKDPKLKALAASVLAQPAKLRSILQRMHVQVVSTHDDGVWTQIASRLALRSDVDQAEVLDQIFGWLTRKLLRKWRDGLPALFSRQELVMVVRKTEARLVKSRVLVRSGAEVPVSPADVRKARFRHFVEHLALINAGEEDRTQAIRHFIQFNIERHRLTDIADIPDEEWKRREYRLVERWQNVARAAARFARSSKPETVGVQILAETTYEHFEPLDGQECRELYMTAGHYHRLADDDEVWWHPQFKKAVKRTR